MKLFNRTNITWLILIILTFVLLEIGVTTGFTSPVMQQTLVTIMINIMLAVGLNLIVGFSGQLALGHAGFMAIGAYATGIMTRQSPNFISFILSVLAGAVIAGIVAFIVGYPTLRLKGDYLAIATLGVAEIIRVAILNMEGLTNGAAGLSGIPIYLMNWRTATVFTVIVVIFVLNYIRSSRGRATIAVREDEIATESLGINTTKMKVAAFVIGAMAAAVAGSVHATNLGVINPSQFGFDRSIDVLITVVFGGIGSITGSIVAGFILGILNLYLQQFGALRMIIYAIALIGIMIFKPSGLLGGREFSLSTLLGREEDRPGFIKSLKKKD
ncbi:MAG: branched-chain amino acid ABC transporter permease [Atopococcus tabaci]|uniref:Branched-chain amino acid ABC transporter permease n=1 Tax=Atopococcus tabaci TaxID=269774 RepID=A0AA43UBR4_9LACT|nr:branched-chain amino acid ABC transporter permease [Atopococcus tabaci]